MQFTWEFSVFDVAIIVGIIVVVSLFGLSFYFSRRSHRKAIDHKFFLQRWQQIEGLLKESNSMNCKLAVIEADKLLDHALSLLNFPGQTMAERLRFASYKHVELKKVWWAHKIRNTVVHEIKYEINTREAKKVIASFKQALRLLHCL